MDFEISRFVLDGKFYNFSYTSDKKIKKLILNCMYRLWNYEEILSSKYFDFWIEKLDLSKIQFSAEE